MNGSTERGESQKPFDVAIVGGGIGGLCLCVGLIAKNIPVTIYEAAPAFAEIGAGVAFGANATRAMALTSPAIRAAYDRRATYNWSKEKSDIWFDFILGQDNGPQGKAGDFIYGIPSPKGQSTVHRAHFLDELVKLIPEDIAKFGKRLETYNEIDDGRVVLRFDDGTAAEHSLLIGCDGIKSCTRQILLGGSDPAAAPIFSGKYAYRGLVPMEKASALLGDQLARNSHMHLGHHGHVLTFPVDDGQKMNVVAFHTKSDGKWNDLAWVKPISRETITEDFADWGSNVKNILSLLEKPEIWALFDHPPAETFSKGHICLLGDAAHATTPHQGSGAGMAIEDALILSNLLGLSRTSADLEPALQVYDQVRRPRTQKVVTTSRDCGLLYDMELPGVEDSIEKIRGDLRERMRWIWEEDLENSISQACQILERKIQN